MEGYWLHKPFAHAAILRGPESDALMYHLTESALDDFEAYVRQDLADRVRNRLLDEGLGADGQEPAAFEQRLHETVADADANGVPLGEALDIVARRTSGVLKAEFDRLSRDVGLTDDFPGAFERFANRHDVPAVTRIGRLLEDSYRATNDLEPILRVATDDLETRNRIRGRQRRNMHPDVLVVVLGVLVYVGIVIVFDTQFLPVGMELALQPQDGLSRAPLQIGEVPAAVYRELFFHSALIQAAGNGLLLGKFVDNRLPSVVKYAAGLTGMTLVAFLVFV
ncbi:MAG: type II secretion system F family protein [Halopenitus sp.]